MNMPKIKIGNLEMKIPIIQGGMSVGISLSNLAAAVANEGGVGVIGAAGIGFMEEDFDASPFTANIRALKKEIQKAREMTDGIIGVNIMKALSDFDKLFITSLKEGVDMIFVGAGMLLAMPRDIKTEDVKKFKSKIVPIVSSSRAVKIIFDFWQKNYGRVPDAVVVEGPKAGGHLGFRVEDIDKEENKLSVILKGVLKIINEYKDKLKIDIPVFAAGGVYTGKDIKKYMEIGASGVQMGTRFVGTHECDASPLFKEAYLHAKKEDIQIIKSPVGMPGRAIINTFLKNIENGIKQPIECNWKCLRSCKIEKSEYCIARALLNAKNGFLDKGFAFAGSNAFRVNKIVSVKELIAELKKDFSE